MSHSFLGGGGGATWRALLTGEATISRRRRRDGKFAALQRAFKLPYFVVLPLALMRCSIASRWLSQTASSSLCQRVAAMAQEADVALYRVQERALRLKRWKLNTEANAVRSIASRTRFAAVREIAAPRRDRVCLLGAMM